MNDYDEELANINPYEIQKTFEDTHSVVEELSMKALVESQRVEEMIADGTIGVQNNDEGHLARLKLVLDRVTSRLMKKSKNDALNERMKQRTEDIQTFINDMLIEHNQLFRLVQNLSKSQKETGQTLSNLSERMLSSEQGQTYQKILDSIIHQFISRNQLDPVVVGLERPNIYKEYSYEMNMLYEILLECHETKARRIHLCLGCWQLISFGNSTIQKYRNTGFRGRNYPLLISQLDIVDVRKAEGVEEPKIYLQDLIYFLWYSGHKFFVDGINEILYGEINTPDLKFMPFPMINEHKKSRRNSIAGRLLSIETHSCFLEKDKLVAFEYESGQHKVWKWDSLMGFMASDKETRTSDWANDVIHLLGMQDLDEEEAEEDDEEISAPFRIDLSDSAQERVCLRVVHMQPEKKIKKRQRVCGIRRKTLLEVKSEVLQKMVEKEQSIMKQIDDNAFKLLFITRDGITTLRARDFQHKYYEMTDIQFNLYTKLVKEEVENDKNSIQEKKKEILEDLNRSLRIQNGKAVIRH